MRIQIIQDGVGNNAGVFIPIEDWTLIKNTYPDVDNISSDIPQWQKDLTDKRLNTIAKNPEHLNPIVDLLNELDKEI